MNTEYKVTYPTLAELKAMTDQDIFNRVATHLLKQGKRASVPNQNGGEACLYRGPNGTACAVGCLIPEAEYSPALEGKSVGLALDASRRELRVLLGPVQEMLDSLQDIHDRFDPRAWPKRLAKLAEREGLQMVSLEGLEVIPMGYAS